MNRFKKIFYIWLVLGLIIISFHPILYYMYVGKVFPKDFSIVGDLARTTYSVDLIDKRFNTIDLPKQHIKNSSYSGENIDFITIGDSFSDGGAGGLNTYYQDYIASIYNVSVMDIKMFRNSKNYIETIYGLLNSGKLEEKGVKYILIESVQRRALERFAVSDINTKNNKYEEELFIVKKHKDIHKNIDKIKPTDNLSMFEIISNLFSKSTQDEISIINNLNQNALVYNLKFKIKGYGKMSPHVYREKLSKELFSTNISDNLLFYDEDLKYLKLENRENIELLNENFNNLAKALQEKNIKLIFMPAVDKYNLYRPYIISNIYQESIFFEYLDTLKKDYIFINTKAILSKELENGEKDIFYVDDTHWSYKASESIIRNDYFNKIFN